MFLILPFGVYEPKSGKLWKKFDHKGVLMRVYVRTFLWFKKELEKYFSTPEYVFIDSNGIMWMSKTFGEFGSVMQLFDLENKKIISPNDSLNYGNPKSMFEDNRKNIFITSGLAHFGQSGAIYKVKDYKTTHQYESKKFKTNNGDLAFSNGIFIGPGVFNKDDEKIYFSTTNGIYKADYVEDVRLINTELVFKPKLIWKQEPLAIGVDMSIKKMIFSSLDELIIITANNGIGVYRNHELTWLN